MALLFFIILKKFVRLLPVADPVGKLEVFQVAGVASFCDRDNMVDAGRQRIRIFQREVNRLSADAAYRLRGIYLFLVSLEGATVGAVSIWSWWLHFSFPLKDPEAEAVRVLLILPARGVVYVFFTIP